LKSFFKNRAFCGHFPKKLMYFSKDFFQKNSKVFGKEPTKSSIFQEAFLIKKALEKAPM
jgi:hypothetical protein